MNDNTRIDVVLTRSQKSFFDIAKKVSELSTYHRKNVKIGCLVVLGHRIIGSGYNSDKTSPVQRKYNKLRFSEETPHRLHAEISALLPLLNNKDIDFSKVKIFTYREKADHSLGKSRPCKSCMALIKDLGIKHIYYTTDDGYCHEVV